jgi:hypothetical protein
MIKGKAERQRESRQLAVARRLFSHAMDRRQKGYLVVENENCTAP